jgi:hypothetical protein
VPTILKKMAQAGEITLTGEGKYIVAKKTTYPTNFTDFTNFSEQAEEEQASSSLLLYNDGREKTHPL